MRRQVADPNDADAGLCDRAIVFDRAAADADGSDQHAFLVRSQGWEFPKSDKNKSPHGNLDKMSREHNKRDYRYYRHVSQKPPRGLAELLFARHIVNSDNEGRS